jgi:hypothetical protein
VLEDGKEDNVLNGVFEGIYNLVSSSIHQLNLGLTEKIYIGYHENLI